MSPVRKRRVGGGEATGNSSGTGAVSWDFTSGAERSRRDHGVDEIRDKFSEDRLSGMGTRLSDLAVAIPPSRVAMTYVFVPQL